MENSRKTLLFICILFLTASVSGWWNSDWNYRKPVDVTEQSGTTLENYPVKVEINTSSLISDGKMNSSCKDVRFVDTDDSSQLDYWIENGCNTSSTKIWTNLTTLSADATKTIFIYYGNNQAKSQSNGVETFELFDHFDTSSLDTSKWIDRSGTRGNYNQDGVLSFSNSIITVGPYNDGGNDYRWINSKKSFSPGSAIKANISMPNYGSDRSRELGFKDIGSAETVTDSTSGIWHRITENTNLKSSDGSTVSDSISNPDWTKYRTTEITWNQTETRTIIDGSSVIKLNSNIPSSQQQAVFGALDWGTIDNDARLKADWILIRNFKYPEPSADIKSEENYGSSPVISGSVPLNNTNKDPSSGVDLSLHVEDNESDKMNITFYNASDDSQIAKLKNKGNGTYTTTWKGLSADQTYEWYVKVTDGSKTTTSSTKSFTTIDISVSWNDESDNEDGFRIYSNASGSFSQVGTVETDTTSYTSTESDLDFGKYTCYRVTAYNQFGESSPAEGCLTP